MILIHWIVRKNYDLNIEMEFIKRICLEIKIKEKY